MIFDVEQARRLIRAFQMLADEIEEPALVAVETAFRNACQQLTLLAYIHQTAGQILRRDDPHGDLAQLVMERIELDPDLGRDDLAQLARIAAGVLNAAPQRRIGGGVWSASLYCDGYFLSDTGKLFCHPVPPGKHGGLSYLKYATHKFLLFLSGLFCKKPLQVKKNMQN